MKLLPLAFAASLATVAAIPVVQAQNKAVSDDRVTIGVLTDLSGIYSSLSGPGSVAAAEMAVKDFGGQVLGKPVNVIAADMLNKADVAGNKAREWYDRDGVDLIMDLPGSAAALAAVQVAKSKNKLVNVTAAVSTRITNEECGPTVFHWAPDSYALASSTARAVLKDGGDSWYFLIADYAGGIALAKDAADVVKASGGTVVGEVRHPFPSSDFSSYLLTAANSKAKVIGLANAGSDTVNSIKQAQEFGLTQKQRIAATILFDTDIHAMGLKTAQGIYTTTGFYWDRNEETRKFGRRFFESQKRMPTSVHAATYSAVLHYLRAVQAAGTDDATPVAQQMRKLPVKDLYANGGTVREDGRMVFDLYLGQVKAPQDSKYPWDYINIRQTVKGADAFLPLARSSCELVRKKNG
jgi:branched-chain amino acid transport system substrate-binding protein